MLFHYFYGIQQAVLNANHLDICRITFVIIILISANVLVLSASAFFWKTGSICHFAVKDKRIARLHPSHWASVLYIGIIKNTISSFLFDLCKGLPCEWWPCEKAGALTIKNLKQQPVYEDESPKQFPPELCIWCVMLYCNIWQNATTLRSKRIVLSGVLIYLIEIK